MEWPLWVVLRQSGVGRLLNKSGHLKIGRIASIGTRSWSELSDYLPEISPASKAIERVVRVGGLNPNDQDNRHYFGHIFRKGQLLGITRCRRRTGSLNFCKSPGSSSARGRGSRTAGGIQCGSGKVPKALEGLHGQRLRRTVLSRLERPGSPAAAFNKWESASSSCEFISESIMT